MIPVINYFVINDSGVLWDDLNVRADKHHGNKDWLTDFKVKLPLFLVGPWSHVFHLWDVFQCDIQISNDS